MLSGTGCNERDRLVFASPGQGGPGPSTVIESPSADTVVPPGPGVIIVGHSVDRSGVDTIYIETRGGVSRFSPITIHKDSVRFALPITTQGQSGGFVTVLIFAVDRQGNRGDTASRLVVIQ